MTPHFSARWRRSGLRLASAVAAVGLLAACTTDNPPAAVPTAAVSITPASPTTPKVDTCKALVARLPETVADQPRRVVTPDDGTTAAWGSPPIVLRCGVPKPKDFNRFSECTVVNRVDWFVPDDWPTEGNLVFTTVGRNVYVEVALPVEYLPPAAAMANLAKPIKATTKVLKRCG